MGSADKWFVSLTVELEDEPERCESQAAVGVDLGVRRLASMATLSDEERRSETTQPRAQKTETIVSSTV